jgi:hypothetical protein
MVRERGATCVAHKQAKAIKFVSAAVLLIGTLIFGGPALAQTDPCPDGKLPAGAGQDIVIDHNCSVVGGTYNYGNVNIIAKGSLVFEENVRNERIDFWTKAILVENGGSLLTHQSVVQFPSDRFGVVGGVLTVHLYGADQGVSGRGIICKSPINNDGKPNPGECGVPNNVWRGESNSLPGGVSDRFYPYDSLPFDDAAVGQLRGYFGYKVLAVSYGGILKVSGDTGVTGVSLAPKATGTSWVRLDGTIPPKATTLFVRPITWRVGDHIVVTTTDYLANHSEELLICKIENAGRRGNKITFTTDLAADPTKCSDQGVKWSHNGQQYVFDGVPSRLGLQKGAAETRAAVGLLTRSVRIVSEGDTYGDCFPPSVKDQSKGCLIDDPRKEYYFGGHTIARQGFATFQVQGVEFRQLGQGGKIGHYPIHFHVARKTPEDTFVRDSSINESMTRWITVHGTQGVEFSRNVGFKSIGHGFYLEDAVETNNKFYSNLGVFARAGVMNKDGTPTSDNPRKVPGILASPDDTEGRIRFGSDKSTPSVFWITNGWNDFQGNMAAGAAFCGVCYWEVPASISGHARHEDWDSYASEQTAGRFGSSPLMNFDGNFCTSALTAFQTVGYTQTCPGVGIGKLAVPIVNPYAPRSNAVAPECGAEPRSNKNWPMCPSDYYPNVNDGQSQQATKCPETGKCDESNLPAATLCKNDDERNCLPTVINDFTTSFNYSEYSFAAVWLRARWHLLSNSFISDVQNAGLTFVGGGDYTHSSGINGLWNEALQTVFVGQTQPQPPDPRANPYASVLSPFNTFTPAKDKFTCDNPKGDNYCISVNNSFVLGPYTAFAVSQHMFNIYDGPANEDSNAYLDIKKVDLGSSSAPSVYKNQVGIPQAVGIDPNAPNIPKGACFIQNAAIAWKQPNGFYYPPTFHSANLFFKNTNIFHYVVVPQFNENKYSTNNEQADARYCNPLPSRDMFRGFSANDRQTVLSDDDGSLTGYVGTTSVSEDPFFKVPVDGVECQSEGSTPERGTARTSPYDYVTTVVYPDDAQFSKPRPPPLEPTCGPGDKLDTNWNSECVNEACFGVPLYRLYQTGSERANKTSPQFIRMAGFNICQRQTMNVNHGHYYVDLTASDATQSKPLSDAPPSALRKNIFIGGKSYDFFLVYAKTDTEQTYKMYVGSGFDPTTGVKLIRADITTAPLVICPSAGADKCKDVPVGGDSTTLTKNYDSSTGILTVTLNLSAFENDFKSASKGLCLPANFCELTPTDQCVGKPGGLGNLTQEERNITCGRAGEDVDCPKGGCVGFQVTLPQGFEAKDQTTANDSALVRSLATCFPKDTDWNVPVSAASPALAGACFGDNAPMKSDFCADP